MTTARTDSKSAQARNAVGIVSSGWFGAWWLTGWQRKYRTLDSRNDWYVARVFRRLLDAEDRYQRENKMGRYSSPNNVHDPRGGKAL